MLDIVEMPTSASITHKWEKVNIIGKTYHRVYIPYDKTFICEGKEYSNGNPWYVYLPDTDNVRANRSKVNTLLRRWVKRECKDDQAKILKPTKSTGMWISDNRNSSVFTDKQRASELLEELNGLFH